MRIHSVFTEAVDLINPGEYHLKYDDFVFRRYYPATDASAFDGKTGIAVLLAVCRRQHFNAFVPIITTKCFLRPSTLDLFIQSPTYHFATSLLLHFPDSDLMAEKPRSYAEEKFVEFSKPLRFLKNVSIMTGVHLFFDLSSLVEQHVLPLLFLEDANILANTHNLPKSTKRGPCPIFRLAPDIFYEKLIDRNEVLPYFHLLKHRREAVRMDAARRIAGIVTHVGPRLSLQRKLIESDALEMLFRLIAGKVDDEIAWGCYMKAAGSLCWRNSEIDFDQQILPHLHLIENFLRSESLELVYCAAYFLRSLIEERSEVIAPKFVDYKLVSTIIEVQGRFARIFLTPNPSEWFQFDVWHPCWDQATLILLEVSKNKDCRTAMTYLQADDYPLFFRIASIHLIVPVKYRNEDKRAWICETLNNLFPVVDENAVDYQLFTAVLVANTHHDYGLTASAEKIARCFVTCLEHREKIFADDRAFFNYVSEWSNAFCKIVSSIIYHQFFRRNHAEVNQRLFNSIEIVIKYELFVFQCCNLKFKLITMKKCGDKDYKNVEKSTELFEAFVDCKVDSTCTLEISSIASVTQSLVNEAADVLAYYNNATCFFNGNNNASVSNDAVSTDEESVPMPRELMRGIQDVAEARNILQRIDTNAIRQEAEETKNKIMDQRTAEMASTEHSDIDEIVMQVAKHFGKENWLQDGMLKKLPSCPIFKEMDVDSLVDIEREIRRKHCSGNPDLCAYDYPRSGPLNTLYERCQKFYGKYKM